MFIDTHCHLQFADYDADRAMIIGNAKKAGVKKFIVPGTNSASSLKAMQLAQKYPGVVYAAIGFHPYEAQKNPDVRELEKLLSYPPSRSQSPPGRWPKDSFQVNAVVAIGECGLDYHMYKGEQALGKKQNQKILFEEQLRLALTYDLPVIMHCRDAFEDFFTILDSLTQMPRGVLHCFSGGLQELRFAQERNFFAGVDGNVTYSKQLQATLLHVPLSMLLLETDAPYLTPTPHRGKRNESKYIPLIAIKVAELQNTSVQLVMEQTTVNALALFHLS